MRTNRVVSLPCKAFLGSEPARKARATDRRRPSGALMRGGCHSSVLPKRPSNNYFPPRHAMPRFSPMPVPGARNMLSPRDALTSAVVEHDLLAIGGHDGSNYLASCEIYTASTPGAGRFTAWTLLPAMGTTRAFHATAAIRRKVFASAPMFLHFICVLYLLSACRKEIKCKKW